MVSIINKSQNIVRSKRKPKAKAMTRSEMMQKILADQKAIRDAIQNDIPLKELKKTHGFKFATLPPVKN